MPTTRYPLRKPAAPRTQLLWRQYLQDTRRPLYCLLFLFPLVATYEFTAIILRPVILPERQLVAQSLIHKLLSWFGGSGFWLPAAALLLTLLVWHILEGHPWRVRGWVLPLMAIESLVQTIPLFVLGQVLLQAESAVGRPDLRPRLVLALGAGIYEELVFRLYLVSGLTLLLESALRIPTRVSRPLIVCLAGGIFAMCHFTPVGGEPFAWRYFLVLALGGAYLTLIFLGRGLGIAAGCHATFNLVPLLWQQWAP